jgi:hypothetical protein
LALANPFVGSKLEETESSIINTSIIRSIPENNATLFRRIFSLKKKKNTTLGRSIRIIRLTELISKTTCASNK